MSQGFPTAFNLNKILGVPGADGAVGQSAYSILLASFTQPAAGATVVASVGSSTWNAVGQTVYVANGGYYLITALAYQSATLQNISPVGNAAAGSTVAAGSLVVAAGQVSASGGLSIQPLIIASADLPATPSGLLVRYSAGTFASPASIIIRLPVATAADIGRQVRAIDAGLLTTGAHTVTFRERNGFTVQDPDNPLTLATDLVLIAPRNFLLTLCAGGNGGTFWSFS